MDLTKFNVSCEMTTDEFLRRLGRAACLEEVQSLRGSLFAVAMVLSQANKKKEMRSGEREVSALGGASVKGEQQGKVDEGGCDSGMVSEMEDEGEGVGVGRESVGMAAESCSGNDCRQGTGERALLPEEAAFRSSLISAVNDLKSDVRRMQSDIQAWRGSHVRSDSLNRL